MKKLLVVLTCILLLAGCSTDSKNAEKAFGDTLLTLQQGNAKIFFETVAQNTPESKFVPIIAKNPVFYSLNYEVLSVDMKDPKTAILNVDITAIDFCATYAIEYLNLFNNPRENGGISIPYSPANTVNVVQDMETMLRILGDNYSALPTYPSESNNIELVPSNTVNKILNGDQVPYRTTNVDVTMKKIGSEWLMNVDEKLTLALAGYSYDENYDFAYGEDFILDFSSPNHSWVLNAAKTSPAEASGWKPSVSFFYDILIGIFAIGALVCGILYLKKRESES